MNAPRNARPIALAGIALTLGLTLAACGGVSQQDVDAIRDQLEVVERRLDDVHGMLVAMHDEVDCAATEIVDEAQQELDETRALLADVLAELAPPPPPPPPEADPMAPAAPGAPAF